MRERIVHGLFRCVFGVRPLIAGLSITTPTSDHKKNTIYVDISNKHIYLLKTKCKRAGTEFENRFAHIDYSKQIQNLKSHRFVNTIER